MSNPYDNAGSAPANNTMAMVSVATGALAVLGNGCCCLPIVSYCAGLLVPVLAITAIATGFMGRSQAQASGGDTGMPTIGAVLGVVGLLLYAGMIVFTIFGSVLYGIVMAANS